MPTPTPEKINGKQVLAVALPEPLILLLADGTFAVKAGNTWQVRKSLESAKKLVTGPKKELVAIRLSGIHPDVNTTTIVGKRQTRLLKNTTWGGVESIRWGGEYYLHDQKAVNEINRIIEAAEKATKPLTKKVDEIEEKRDADVEKVKRRLTLITHENVDKLMSEAGKEEPKS